MKHVLTSLLLMWMGMIQAQTLVSISPNTGSAGSSVNVTITGSGTSFTNNTVFVLAQGASILQLSNISAQSATVIMATVSIPANATSGTYTLTLAGLPPKQLSNAFTVTGGGQTASIVSVSPDQGYQNDFVSVEIKTTGTQFGNTVDVTGSLIKAGSQPIPFDFVSPVDDTTLFAYINLPSDATLGQYSVVLTSISNGVITKANAFSILENPNGSVQGMTPDQGNKGDTLLVMIHGKSTHFTNSTDISGGLFGDMGTNIFLANVNVLNDSTIEAEMMIPRSARSGIYSLFLNMDTNTLFLTDAFTVLSDGSADPSLVSISPAKGYPGQTLDITINATATHFNDSLGMAMALFSNDTFVEANEFYVVNDSTLVGNFTIPDNFIVGSFYAVGVVTDADGFIQLAGAFEVIAQHTGLSKLSGIKVSVYPNPASDELWVVIPASINNAYLIDITGKRLEVNLETIDHFTGKYRVSLSDRKPGIYNLLLETDQGIQRQRFIIR
jgi:hypothetical protein